MEGSGTKESPYKITTVQELRTVMGTANAYGILKNDLDCNKDKIDYWESINGGNSPFKEIDFDGHYLTNVFIKNANYFYKSSVSYSAEKPVMKNGSIINVYEDEGLYFADGIEFLLMGLSIYARNFSNGIFNPAVQLYLCNVRIDNQNVDEYSWFMPSGNGSTYYAYMHTKFTLKGKITNNGLCNYYNSNLAIKDCLFEGKLTGNCTDLVNTTYALATGCIFNIDVTEVTGITEIGKEKSGIPYVNIVNGEKIPSSITSTDTYVVFDEDEFYDPKSYNDIGFYMVEVK